MSRYHREFNFHSTISQKMYSDIHQYLSSEGYEFRKYEGENLYKKGKGIATGPTFIKVMADGNAVIVEAWVKFAVVPGVYAGEISVDPAVPGMAAIPRKQLKKRVDHIETIISSYGGVLKHMPNYNVGVEKNAPQSQPVYQPVQQPQQVYQPQQRPQPVHQPQAQVRQQHQPRPQQSYQQQAYIFCTSCGTKLPADSRFCRTCGKKL